MFISDDIANHVLFTSDKLCTKITDLLVETPRARANFMDIVVSVGNLP